MNMLTFFAHSDESSHKNILDWVVHNNLTAAGFLILVCAVVFLLMTKVLKKSLFSSLLACSLVLLVFGVFNMSALPVLATAAISIGLITTLFVVLRTIGSS
jgi:uncharacterized protein YhhL (DUF1145 family)